MTIEIFVHNIMTSSMSFSMLGPWRCYPGPFISKHRGNERGQSTNAQWLDSSGEEEIIDLLESSLRVLLISLSHLYLAECFHEILVRALPGSC